MSIRADRLSLSTDDFAAERRAILDRADDALAEHVRAALMRLGLPSWENRIVNAALDLFDETARAEIDAWGPVVDDMRDEFARELRDTLLKTKSGQNRQAQIETITRWVSTMTINAATEAATTADPDEGVGLEWVTMTDSKVRDSHEEMHGTAVPTGQPFEIEGVEFLYPGQPNGDPSLWINCVPGSTKVGWAGQYVLNATRRTYEGTLVHLTTAGGRVLTITPNHPVLTTAGYIPAGRLSVGDNVLAADPVTPEVDDAPPSIEQVFSSLRDTGIEQRVIGRTVDFHGDGTTNEVQIVGADGDLARPVGAERGDSSLIGLDEGLSATTASGEGNVARPAVGSIAGSAGATSGMSGGGVSTALGGSGTGISNPVGFGTGAQGQAEFEQSAGDGDATDAEFFGHLKHALSVGMTPDQIVAIEVDTGSHDVYNLHTSENYYTANGIAVHNCRCVARPTMLTEANSKTITAAGDEERDDDRSDSAVIVALPAEGDWTHSVSSEDDAHVTLLFLGDADGFDPAPIEAAIEQVAADTAGEVIEAISGYATLGDDEADVVLLDAKALAGIRGAILGTEDVRAVHDGIEQYPTWIPHLTLGYPDNPRKSDDTQDTIKFDRLALWRGEEQKEFPMGKKETENSVVAAAETDEEAPEITEDDAYLPVPWHGVLAPEGKPSGDKRMFAEGALRNRDLPLPLKYMKADADGHDGSVVVARIDRIFREDNLIKAEGVFGNSPDAYEAIRQLANGMLRGVSVDVDDAQAALSEDDDELAVFSSARISSATICAIPAFAEAYVALGPWADSAEVSDVRQSEDDEYSDDGSALAKDLESRGAEIVSRETSAKGAHFAVAKYGTYDHFPDCTDGCALNHGVDQTENFADAPGLKKDGTPPQCKYCKEVSTHYVLWAEGMAYVPACDAHIADAEAAIEDPDDIVRVAEYSDTEHTFAPVPRKTKDGPGWITDPKPTKRITDYWVDGPGAAKISWGAEGDFYRCEAQLAKYVQNPEWLAGLCANLHYRALRAWPGQASGKVEAMANKSNSPSVSLVASADQKKISADYFRNPEFTDVSPIEVTEDGRVFGHLATWDVCHIGIGADCVNPPHSETDYGFFATGKVLTDAGPVAVGQISMGGGHAQDGIGIRAAAAHYDSTSAAVADVAVGEDEFGIWVSGKLRDDVDADDIHALRASGVLSGDWREVIIGGESNMELVAALAVNVPGFPIPRPSLAASGGQVTSLVAASIPQGKVALSDEKIDERIDAAFARRERVQKAQAIRAEMRARRAQEAKAAMASEGR